MKKRIISLLLIAVMAFTLPAVSQAADFEAITAANKLYILGLFKGVAENPDGSPVYDLDRAMTRQEAVAMLVRLIGMEDAALKTDCSQMRFTDVDKWAAPYVQYAFENSLTTGTGETTFDGSAKVTAAQYITFVLRALGYDSSTDFTWDEAWEKSDKLGLTDGRFDEDSDFTRGDAVIVSYSALSAFTKSGGETLLERLCDAGAVTESDAASVGLTDAAHGGKTPLAAKEIFALRSSAVFYMAAFASTASIFTEEPDAGGSGFFITDDGVAVTNYHIIEGMIAADVTMSDGEIHAVKEVLFYDKVQDIAVIRVSRIAESGDIRDSFPYIETLRTLDEVENGEVIYTIGSPMGLQNTISDGIVSSRRRVLGDETVYIQITAPISHGSSGGVLFNEYGEAIGVTTASIEAGQSLNFAVPLDPVLQVDYEADGDTLQEVYDKEWGNSPIDITSDPVSVTLEEGTATTVYITIDTNESQFSLAFEIDDSDIVYCMWAGWEEDYRAKLRIVGMHPGKTNVRVMTDIFGAETSELVIPVIVK